MEEEHTPCEYECLYQRSHYEENGASNKTGKSVLDQQNAQHEVDNPNVTADTTNPQKNDKLCFYSIDDPRLQAQVALQKESIFSEESTKQEVISNKILEKLNDEEDEKEGATRGWMTADTLSHEEKLIILFDELQLILESDEYDDSLRKSLQESNPGYLEKIEKRKKDLFKEDHGILVAGETSSGKSTLINKILQKRIFKAKLKESTSTICKIRNSDEVRIITKDINGELRTVAFQEKCDLETDDGLKSLRDTLENLTDVTSARDSNNFQSVDVGFPIPFLKGNTIIVDTPGIGGSGDYSEKLMEYLPNAVSFIFVVDVASAGGMQNDRLPHILRSIVQLQIEDEIPCFDPRDVIFVTNKWDAICKEEDSSDNDEQNIWEELKKDIKKNWPSVKEENIFRMSLRDVSPNKTNASTKEFEKFNLSIKTIIKKSENIRLLQHLRNLHELLKNVLKGIDSGLVLRKKSEEEQMALTEKHMEKIKELKSKCKEEERELRDNFQKMIQDSATEVFDYMSTPLGKDRILNPPGQKRLIELPYFPNDVFGEQLNHRLRMYVRGVLQSEKNQKKFIEFKERVLAFYTEMLSEISEMESDWTEYSEGTHVVNVEEGSMVPILAGVIATSPLWIPLLVALTGVAIVISPICIPVILYHLREENRQEEIDLRFERCRSSIKSRICNHLKETYGQLFETLIQKTVNEILPRKINALEKMIHELSENRQRILANQKTLERLSEKLKSIEQRKFELQTNVESVM